MGEEQMSLQCRVMYADQELQSGMKGSSGILKPAEDCFGIIENYKNCKKFWNAFIKQNNLRHAPVEEERKQILDYMKSTGSVAYHYVKPERIASRIVVDVNLGKDPEQLRREKEFQERLEAKMREKMEK